MSSATTYSASPTLLQRRTDHVHATDVRGAQQHALALGARLGEDLDVLDAHQAARLLLGQLADPHHVDEVLRVVAERTARRVTNPRVVGREAHRPRQVLRDEALLRSGQVVGEIADGRGRRHRQATRQRADEPLAAAVQPERQLLALPLAARRFGAGGSHPLNVTTNQRRLADRFLHRVRATAIRTVIAASSWRISPPREIARRPRRQRRVPSRRCARAPSSSCAPSPSRCRRGSRCPRRG